MNTVLKILLILALLIITAVIPLGAFTRLSDAGLGCPDWPGCYGYLDFRNAMEHVERINTESPGSLREAHKTWPEMVHRYFASKLGLLIMLMAMGALWVSRKDAQLAAKWGHLPWILFILVCFQGALGMWTVTMKLYPPTVVGHLFGGFFTFALLSILAARVFNLQPLRADEALKPFGKLAALCFVVLLIQIGLGGWMSANYAALVCTQLPVCEAGWIGKIDFIEAFSAPYHHGKDYEFGLLSHDARVTIHVLHRVFALLVTGLLLVLLVNMLRAQIQSYSRKIVWLVLGLLVLQVALGLSNVIFNLPIAIATAHNGVGALLMAALFYLNFLCRQPRI